jgi:hypothetical protein
MRLLSPKIRAIDNQEPSRSGLAACWKEYSEGVLIIGSIGRETWRRSDANSRLADEHASDGFRQRAQANGANKS